MRILHITPSFQHPKVRGPNRHYHFIRELSQRHSITLLTLVSSEITAEAMQEMASYTERILTFGSNGSSNLHKGRWLGHLPVIGDRTERTLQLRAGVKQMKKAFVQLLEQESYDLVLFHGKSVFPVIEDWAELPIVADFCDATSMRVHTRMSYASKAKLPLLGLRYLQIRQIEKKLVRKTPHIAFISVRDREAILGPYDRSEVIPNGLDLQYWRRKSNSRQPDCLIFTGVMNYAPNEDAALYLIDEILPFLRQSVPNLEVLIVGRDPTSALSERGRRHPEVTVTGFVDDMRPYLERAAIFAAPVRYASGMQNKIQEAMAMEVPVVTTSAVAGGLRTGSGPEPPLYVADEPRAFADSISSLLVQDTERARLAAEGRRFAEKNFDWPRSAQQLEHMCLEAVRENDRS
jgi:glycosyltransferase involved in cell wall biosynthesis